MTNQDISLIDRRRLLTATAAMATASVAPRMKLGGTEVIEQALPPPEQPFLNVTQANARRLAEIVRRNVIRREAGLPLLPIANELRRMKTEEELQEFEPFEAAHHKAVWDQVLTERLSEVEGNPNWRPSWTEGVFLQSKTRKILWARFRAKEKGTRPWADPVMAAPPADNL